MREKTSMFELLKERLTEEEIIKITCDYDLKFCELEEENKQLKDQLQQKENIIKEVREYIEPIAELDNDIMLKGKVLKPVLEILDKANDKENK